MSQIQRQMEVVGSCGKHVGTVDAVEDDSIRLMRTDTESGLHHFIPMCWVEAVGQTVRLTKTHDEAVNQWHVEPFATSISNPTAAATGA